MNKKRKTFLLCTVLLAFLIGSLSLTVLIIKMIIKISVVLAVLAIAPVYAFIGGIMACALTGIVLLIKKFRKR